MQREVPLPASNVFKSTVFKTGEEPAVATWRYLMETEGSKDVN